MVIADEVTGCVTEILPAFVEWKTLVACLIVMVNPLVWNTVGRFEYRTHLVSGTFGGPKRGCALLGLCILSLNGVRTTLFHKVMDNHATCAPMENTVFSALGYLLIAVGAVLVISSAYQLGFFCTFMGDHFGILLSKKATGFPFNVVSDPMYVGAGLIYFGFSFQHASVMGIIFAGLISLSYLFAAMYEAPFTAQIYKNKKN